MKISDWKPRTSTWSKHSVFQIAHLLLCAALTLTPPHFLYNFFFLSTANCKQMVRKEREFHPLLNSFNSCFIVPSRKKNNNFYHIFIRWKHGRRRALLLLVYRPETSRHDDASKGWKRSPHAPAPMQKHLLWDINGALSAKSSRRRWRPRTLMKAPLLLKPWC